MSSRWHCGLAALGAAALMTPRMAQGQKTSHEHASEVTRAAQEFAARMASAQEIYHGRKVWELQNDKMKVLIAPGGGHIASLALRAGRGANLNPLWLPPWQSIEPGQWTQARGKYGEPPEAALLASILGQNICLDFFGAPSKAETAAGIPVHGEAPCITWSASQQTANKIVYSALLSNAQLRVTRNITLAPGSSAIWIKETVENMSAFDRPFGWQQHPTLGPPFLETGATFFDLPGTKSLVNKGFSKGQRLKAGEEFTWPSAPSPSGETVDLREWPKGEKSSDYTVSLMDPTRTWGFFTAINTKKGLLIGYVWPRKDWPWVGNWEENHFRDGKPWLRKALTRGMEFGASPFPESRHDAVKRATLFDTPTYRWISANEKQTIAYSAFLASIPAGTTGVKDVQVVGRSIKITLNGVDKTITLAVQR